MATIRPTSPLRGLQNSIVIHALGAYKSSNLYGDAPFLVKVTTLLVAWLVPTSVVRPLCAYVAKKSVLKKIVGSSFIASLLSCHELDGVYLVDESDVVAGRLRGDDTATPEDATPQITRTPDASSKYLMSSMRTIATPTGGSLGPLVPTPFPTIRATCQRNSFFKAVVILQGSAYLASFCSRLACHQNIRHLDIMNCIGALLNVTSAIITLSRPTLNTPIYLIKVTYTMPATVWWLEHVGLAIWVVTGLVIFMCANIILLEGPLRITAIVAGAFYCVGVVIEAYFADGSLRMASWPTLRRYNILLSSILLLLVTCISYADNFIRGDDEESCAYRFLPVL